MRTIHKYRLEITNEQRIEMPIGARPLHVDVQHGQLCLWCEVDTLALMMRRRVFVVGTGDEMPSEARGCAHIGSVLMAGGAIVWHVYVE